MLVYISMIISMNFSCLLFTPNNLGRCYTFKSGSPYAFKFKVFSFLRFFIRWDVVQSKNGSIISQKRDACRLLQRFGLESYIAATVLLPWKEADARQVHEDSVMLKLQHQFRSMVVTISCLSICTCPDITYVIQYFKTISTRCSLLSILFTSSCTMLYLR